MILFKDEKIVEFLEENNLEEKELIPYISEVKIFLNDPKNYSLKYNEGIELMFEKKDINSGITYLSESFFNQEMKLSNIDFSTPMVGIDVKKFVANKILEKENFYLVGSNGIGKTTLIITIVNNNNMKNNKKTLYVSWPDFIEKSKNFSDNNGYVNRVKYASNLIIDDLGGESVTQWSRDDILFSTICYRLEKKLSTIIISNYTQKELLEKYKIKKNDNKTTTSIVSKINGLCPEITMTGVNYRNGDRDE